MSSINDTIEYGRNKFWLWLKAHGQVWNFINCEILQLSTKLRAKLKGVKLRPLNSRFDIDLRDLEYDAWCIETSIDIILNVYCLNNYIHVNNRSFAHYMTESIVSLRYDLLMRLKLWQFL